MRIDSSSLDQYQEILNWEPQLQELLKILFGGCDFVQAEVGENTQTQIKAQYSLRAARGQISLAFEDLPQSSAVLTMQFAERLHYQRSIGQRALGQSHPFWSVFQPIEPKVSNQPWHLFNVRVADYSGRCWMQTDIELLTEEKLTVEKKMERGEENVQLSLSLGEIELSVHDLLRLRPGMVIKFERPKQFEAALEVGGAAWGEASIEIGADAMELRVIKTALNDTASSAH